MTTRKYYNTRNRPVYAAGQTNVLGQFTYNSQHLPLMAVDAAGQTNYFGYNTNGQLTAITNALNQVTTLSYDTNACLTNILGALPGATANFTYDGYGRLQTATDSEGYTVTYDYDALNRPTKVTYPDGRPIKFWECVTKDSDRMMASPTSPGPGWRLVRTISR